MDYMIYNHDQFSLLDMIEVESAQFENWYTGNREPDSETKHFAVGSEKLTAAKSVNSSLLEDLVRLESLHGNVLTSSAHSVETDWLEREECMNWEPHLLVNPRTGAPINSGDSDSVCDGAPSLVENKAFTILPLTESTVKRQSVSRDNGLKTLSQPMQSFTAFTPITTCSNVALQPQLMPKQSNTVQVYLQVTNAVGNLIPSDGTLCLIKMESEEDPSAQSLESASRIVVEPVDDGDDAVAGNEAAFEKPVFSYSCLIAMALKNSDNGSLPVNEIYAYILDKFPYFRTAPDGWKNSIRHNLSLNKCFEKIDNPTVNGSSRKGCLWGLNPAKADKMDEEIAKWLKRAVKSNLSLPLGGGCSTDNNVVMPSSTVTTNGESNATLQPSTPTLLTVCSQSQSIQPGSAVTIVSNSGELNMLEDSSSADPMLAGAAAQTSIWDDETDELVSSAISFGARRVVTKATRTHVVPDKDSWQSSSATCRSYLNKSSLTSSRNDHRNMLTTSVAIPAIE